MHNEMLSHQVSNINAWKADGAGILGGLIGGAIFGSTLGPAGTLIGAVGGALEGGIASSIVHLVAPCVVNYNTPVSSVEIINAIFSFYR
jgi:hypothetical protein